jgi:hypothetical protein
MKRAMLLVAGLALVGSAHGQTVSKETRARITHDIVMRQIALGPLPDTIGQRDPVIVARERAIAEARERRYRRNHRSLVAAQKIRPEDKR